MELSIGATGQTIIGDVLDVNKSGLERSLKDYEPRLYLQWNPKKNKGYGKWELRIRPETKTIKEVLYYKGASYCVVDYKENMFDNHVFDLESLNYSVLERLRQGDVWAQANYERGHQERITRTLRDIENKRQADKDESQRKARSEMHYNLMQDKKVLEDFQDRIRSGVNPAHLTRFWKR